MDDPELANRIRQLLNLWRLEFLLGMANTIVNLITIFILIIFSYRAGKAWQRESDYRKTDQENRDRDQRRYEKHVEITQHYMEMQKNMLALFHSLGKEAAQTVNRVETKVERAVEEIKRSQSNDRSELDPSGAEKDC